MLMSHPTFDWMSSLMVKSSVFSLVVDSKFALILDIFIRNNLVNFTVFGLW